MEHSPFTAFYDASGSESLDGHLVVAGVVSNEELWTHLDTLWSMVLDQFGVDTLHMREFAHSRGQFREWRGANERRALFMQRLIEVICAGVPHAFVAGLHLPDFRRVAETVPVPDGPYGFVAAAASLAASSWREKHSRERRLPTSWRQETLDRA